MIKIFCVVCKEYIVVKEQKDFSASGHDAGEGWSGIKRNLLHKTRKVA